MIAGLAAADISGVGLLVGLGLMLFGAFAGDAVARTDPRIELKNQVRSQMAKQEDEFLNKTRRQYLDSVNRYTALMQLEVTGRIDDMEAQLQRIIREKESKELSAQEQKEQLLTMQTNIRLIGQNAVGVLNR